MFEHLVPAVAGVLGGCRKLETGTLLAELGYWGGTWELEFSPGRF